MAKKQTQLSATEKKKFGLGEFVWMGFNYTVGISFIGACAGLSNIQSGGIGMNILWVYIVEGILAGICAWAFAKLARAYKSSNNGGAYIYARGSLNKFVGLFVTFMLYVGMPFMITFQILMLIRGTFSPSFVWKTSQDTIPWYGFQWGVFGDLYLDLIGIGIYMLSALVIFFGIKWYKKAAHITLAMKWIPAILLIIAAVVSACMSGGMENLKGWSNYSSSDRALHINKIVSSFNSCFYFFAGFEIFSTAGKNVRNPQKNIGLGVTIIMIVSTIFYVLVLLAFFAAIDPESGFQQNETMAFWGRWANKSDVLLYGGPILIIVSSISLKVNAAMQNSLYSGTMLQPMAVEGYFPDSWGKLDKDGLPVKASKINLFIVALFVVIWLTIPDMVRAFECKPTYEAILNGSYSWPAPTPLEPLPWPQYGEYGKEAAEQWLAKQPVAFDVSSLTAASSTITIIVYITALICAIKMGKNKQITLKVWEWIAFPVTLLFMTFLFFYHYYEVFDNAVTGIKTHESTLVTGSVVELVFVMVAIIFFIVWYYTYYTKKFNNRLLTKPNLQKELDSEFLPMDDWSFVALTISNMLISKPISKRAKVIKLLDEYLTRNIAINKTINNQNYREATRVRNVLINIKGPTLTNNELRDLQQVVSRSKSLDETIQKLNKYVKVHEKTSTSPTYKIATHTLKKLNAPFLPITNSLKKVSQRYYEIDSAHEIFNEIQIQELINDELTPN